MKIIKYFILFFLISYNLYPKEITIGIGGLVSKSQVTSNFSSLDGIQSCCDSYKIARGGGYVFQTTFGYRISPNFRSISKISFSNDNIYYKINKKETLGIENELFDGIIQNRLDLTISDFSVHTGIMYTVGYFHIDLSIYASYPVSSTYYQEERIIEPKDRGVFTDTKTRIRNINSGKVNVKSFRSSIEATFGYKLPLHRSKELYLVPKASIGLTLAELINNSSISQFLIKIGCGVEYTIGL